MGVFKGVSSVILMIALSVGIVGLGQAAKAYDNSDMEVDLQSKSIELFTDLDEGNQYYESVYGLAEMGVIKGYGDGTVRVNRYATLAEVVTLIQRGVNKADDIDWDWLRNREMMKDNLSYLNTYSMAFLGIIPWWPSMELAKPEMTDDMTKIYLTVGDVANLILGAYKVSSIRPTLYGFSHTDLSSMAGFIVRGYDINKIANDIVNMDIEDYNSGVIGNMAFIRNSKEESDEYDIIDAVEDTTATRGEVCDMLYWAIHSDLRSNRELQFDASIKSKIIEPILVSDSVYEYGIEDQRIYQDICYDTSRLPSDLRDTYCEFGGKVSYYDPITWEILGNPGQAVGKFSYDDLSIDLSQSGKAVYHEFGHFLQLVVTDVDKRVREAFENKVEFDEFTKLDTIGQDYGKTSPEEFFAEVFSIYMTNPELILEQCPTYYEIISDGLSLVGQVLNEYKVAGNSIMLYPPIDDFKLHIKDGVVYKIPLNSQVETEEGGYIE